MPTTQVQITQTIRWSGDICGVQDEHGNWKYCDFCHEESEAGEFCCTRYFRELGQTWWLNQDVLPSDSDPDGETFPMRNDPCKKDHP